MINNFLYALSLLTLAYLMGCTTPAKLTSAAMKKYDRDTKYAIEEQTDGFVITINYERYQMIPETGALMTACKSSLNSLAHEHARQISRDIQPIDEQMMRISTGRIGLTGITSCAAQVRTFWK